MKGGARQNSDHAPIMKLRFDRGTILLTDSSKDLKLGEAPGVLWDPRVNAYRAPASPYPALKRWLLERGTRFEDITTHPRPTQEAWSDVDLRSYQEAALSAWELGHRRGVVALPTRERQDSARPRRHAPDAAERAVSRPDPCFAPPMGSGDQPSVPRC